MRFRSFRVLAGWWVLGAGVVSAQESGVRLRFEEFAGSTQVFEPSAWRHRQALPGTMRLLAHRDPKVRVSAITALFCREDPRIGR